jgi:hypothetical protein
MNVPQTAKKEKKAHDAPKSVVSVSSSVTSGELTAIAGRCLISKTSVSTHDPNNDVCSK